MINVPNPEVLKAAFAGIQENLDYWSQDTWCGRPKHEPPSGNTCGTTACLAGHILLATGTKWEDLRKIHVSEEALKALGYVWADDVTGWSGDGWQFGEIFYWITDEETYRDYEYTQEAFDRFRAQVSELTGIEL